MNGLSHNGAGNGNGSSATHALPDGSATSATAQLLATAGDPNSMSRDQRTDEQLLGDYRAGDKQSFATLVARYQRELFHFLVRFLGDRAAAEDVFQETFLQVHQSAEQFDLSRRFRPWLFTISANKARHP